MRSHYKNFTLLKCTSAKYFSLFFFSFAVSSCVWSRSFEPCKHPRCNTFYVAFSIKISMNIFGLLKECDGFQRFMKRKLRFYFLFFRFYARDKKGKKKLNTKANEWLKEAKKKKILRCKHYDEQSSCKAKCWKHNTCAWCHPTIYDDIFCMESFSFFFI